MIVHIYFIIFNPTITNYDRLPIIIDISLTTKDPLNKLK